MFGAFPAKPPTSVRLPFRRRPIIVNREALQHLDGWTCFSGGIFRTAIHGVRDQPHSPADTQSISSVGTLCWLGVSGSNQDSGSKHPSRLSRDLAAAGNSVGVGAFPFAPVGGLIALPAEALNLAKSFPCLIHLLIIHIVVPGMNGKKLAERLAGSTAGFRSIFMSGYTHEVIAHRGVPDEGIDFL